MENGLRLSWWQVITLCIMLASCFAAQMVGADNSNTEKNKKQDYEIKCKLDESKFDKYVEKHAANTKEMVEKLDQRLVKLQKEVQDSNLEIVRILTRMENK